MGPLQNLRTLLEMRSWFLSIVLVPIPCPPLEGRYSRPSSPSRLSQTPGLDLKIPVTLNTVGGTLERRARPMEEIPPAGGLRRRLGGTQLSLLSKHFRASVGRIVIQERAPQALRLDKPSALISPLQSNPFFCIFRNIFATPNAPINR